MYEWGRFEGGYSKFAEIQRRRELAAQIEALERENEKLRAQVAAAELARDVDRQVVRRRREEISRICRRRCSSTARN